MALIRIVRMVFAPEFIPRFKTLFHESSPRIRAFVGCTKLELWQDAKYENIFYTYSHWASADHLELYRSSELFNSVWRQTKEGFVDKPQAWSTHSVMEVEPLES